MPGDLGPAAEEERALVAAAVRGDRAAFASLVVAHQRALFSFAWRRLRHVEDARDLTQRVLVKAYESLASFRGEARLRTWLFSIAVRFALDAQRAAARRDVELPEPEPVDTLAKRDEARRLRAAIATLPDKQRMTVELRAFEELSFSEVGEVVGISEASAKANYHHAVAKLREQMRTEP